MNYTWTDGEVITAEKLNNTGYCVLNVTLIDKGNLLFETDKTWKEINDAFTAGITVIFHKHITERDQIEHDEYGAVIQTASGSNGSPWVATVVLGGIINVFSTDDGEDSHLSFSQN